MPLPRLLLVYGNPGNGKSHLANNILVSNYGYHHVDGDLTYVDFIHDRHPELYFTRLHRFIGPQYESVVLRWLPEVDAEWWAFLRSRIEGALTKHPKVVASWYRLNDFDATPLTGTADIVVVHVIDGRNGRYQINQQDRPVESFA